jgi:hypothetical protein
MQIPSGRGEAYWQPVLGTRGCALFVEQRLVTADELIPWRYETAVWYGARRNRSPSSSIFQQAESI